MLKIAYILRTALLFSFLFVGSSWDFLVHQTIGELAIYKLPRNMRPFFYKNMDYLLKEMIQPDLRRSRDSLEGPRHFIDLELYGDSAAWKMPLTWEGAVIQYGKDSLLKYGYVPYQVIMIKQRLTRAFLDRNKDSILFYAADLGHYIGDAHVPLHSTANYDGQLSGQKGIHALWETMIPEIELDQYQLCNGHTAQYVDDPAKAIWDAVRTGHGLLAELFQQEKETEKSFTDSAEYQIQRRKGKEYKTFSPAFAKSYSKRLAGTVNKQLLRSADLLADFWYTSWVDGGKPDLDQLLTSTWDKKDKKMLKASYQAYRNDELVKKHLLWARNNQHLATE
jgi:hypothetical protein